MLGLLGSIGSALMPTLKSVGRTLASSLIDHGTQKIGSGLSKRGIKVSQQALNNLSKPVYND